MIKVMKVKVLFLDIDGVLNSADWYEQRTKEQQFSGLCELDIEAMHLYDEIVERTGCNVVLSSVWRFADNYKERLERQGLNTNKIIDRTPHMPRPRDTGTEYAERGKEIKAWLDSKLMGLPCVYAILDDDSDMLPEQPHFKTSWQTGLTREIAEAVITHLNA